MRIRDSRLLEVARERAVQLAKQAGLKLRHTYAKESKALRRRAGGYARARQFERLRRVVRRQRTILGQILREVESKLAQVDNTLQWANLRFVLDRAERILTQQPRDKNKLYALHAPEVECIGKGEAHKPYEFGVKASVAITARKGLIVGALTFPGNPYDGHVLSSQREQATIVLEDVGGAPKRVLVDLDFRRVDADNIPNAEILHRGKIKPLSLRQCRWLKRRQAMEPVIGNLKADHRMDRGWLTGELGDAFHVELCAVGYNMGWLMRAVARLGLKAFLRLAWGLSSIAARHSAGQLACHPGLS